MSNHNKALTLLELLISLILLGVVVLAIFSIEYFSRSNVVSSVRMATLQNEASCALEHMSKWISQAIGSVTDPTPTINVANIAGDRAIQFRLDSNGNGRRDAADTRMAYRWTGLAGANSYLILYCPNCTNPPCTQCNPNWNEVIARNVIYFGNPNPPGPAGPIVPGGNNFIPVQVRVCSNTASFGTCGTVDNPTVTMSTNIKMPSVSTH